MKQRRIQDQPIRSKLTTQKDAKERLAIALTIAYRQLASQNMEREKMAEELISQNREKKQRAAELIIANKELAFQNIEKENRALELIVANKELVIQNNEKEKRAAELLIANDELAFQNTEKENRASELIVANRELLFQNAEKERRAAELIIANKELAFQNKEKEKRAAELVLANSELKDIYASQQDYIKDLQEVMYKISHELRQPIVQIMGLTSLLNSSKNTVEEISEMNHMLKDSAKSLDTFTRELTAFIFEAELKVKNKINL